MRWTNLAVFSEEWSRTVSSAGTRTPKTHNSRYNFLTYLLTDFTQLGTDDVVRGHCSALFCNSTQAATTKWWTRETVEERTLAPLLQGPEKMYATGLHSLHSCVMSIGLCILLYLYTFCVHLQCNEVEISLTILVSFDIAFLPNRPDEDNIRNRN